MTFSGERQKTPTEDERMNPEGPDKDKTIKFDRVCFFPKQKHLSCIQYTNKCVNASKNYFQEFKKLYEYFSARVLDALVKTTKLSLETLKRRICGTM